MNAQQIIKDFIAKVPTAKDPEVLTAMNLAAREMELFLAALNVLPEEGLEIPELNALGKSLKIASPYIQALKNKGLIKSGKKRGQWNLTEGAVKKMNSFLKNELSSGRSSKKTKRVVKAGKKTSKKARSAIDISAMSIGEIRARIQQIDDQVIALTEEREQIRKQAKEQLGSFIK